MRFYPAREVSLIVNICCRNVKNDRFVSIRCVFSSSKIRQNSFSAIAPPGPRWGSSWRSPGPIPLDAFNISISPPSAFRLSDPQLVWNLYTWPSGQKGWTPLNRAVVVYMTFWLVCHCIFCMCVYRTACMWSLWASLLLARDTKSCMAGCMQVCDLRFIASCHTFSTFLRSTSYSRLHPVNTWTGDCLQAGTLSRYVTKPPALTQHFYILENTRKTSQGPVRVLEFCGTKQWAFLVLYPAYSAQVVCGILWWWKYVGLQILTINFVVNYLNNFND